MAKRILVVDDDENILSLERTILEQKGFHVTTAAGVRRRSSSCGRRSSTSCSSTS